MAYKNFNLNPAGRNTEDCAVRAMAAALNMSWKEIYTGLCEQGFWLCDMPCANRVWKTYLIGKGWKRNRIPSIPQRQSVQGTIQNFVWSEYRNSNWRNS